MKSLFSITEPTNNVSPKVLDNKVRFTLFIGNIKDTIFITCPVAAYPVPMFRYVLGNSIILIRRLDEPI